MAVTLTVVELQALIKTEVDAASQRPILDRRYYTIKETAAMMGLPESTAYAYAKDGTIETVDLAGRRLVPATFFDALARKSV